MRTRRPVSARFMEKVDVTDSCWIWTASTNPNGYGKFYVDGRVRSAHRVAYELFIGEIPSGRDLDHLCRVRHCVNPEHLEPVTRRENSLRGASPFIALYHQEKCSKGHLRPKGARCNECNAAWFRAWRRKQREAS